jgi:uncharacterized protein (TIGR04141 family)
MAQLTFFRIKPEVTNPDDVIADRGSMLDLEVRVAGRHLGVLYIDRSVRKRPRWLDYFGDAVEISGQSLGTASVGAVLLLAHGGSLYALVFGYGRHLIEHAAIESRFGLRATLNAVEPTQLRSIDHKRLEAISRHTREELSRAAGMEQFGLDVERDLLRAVTGTPENEQYGRRLSGADQLTVIADIPLSQLTSALEKYAALAKRDDYKEHFSWVDNVAEITDPSLTRILDERLVKLIKTHKADAWLAPPEIVDWSSVAAFRYSTRKSAVEYPDLDFDEYFAEYGGAQDLTVGRLDQDRVYCVKADDETAKKSWSIHRCLVAEIDYKAARYIISEGKWYRVDAAFLATVEQFIGSIPASSISFPPFKHAREEEYTKSVAKKNKNLVLLDQDFVNFPGRGKIEVCDLYSDDRAFIHIKRWGASSSLSHLFAQGTVSAQLLVHEPGFRYDFHEKLPDSHKWGDPRATITPSDFEVCFGIIGRKKKAFSLPFFSKVNLRTAVRSIRALGLKVSMAPISA